MASPACLSPSNCAISDRSRPSPASAVPSSSFLISFAHSGRRSSPSNALLASLAMPMRSAQPARAAAAITSGSNSMAKLRKFRGARAGEHELDLGYDACNAIELALQVSPGEAGVRRPCFGDEARAETKAQHCGRLLAAPLDSDGLTDQT